MAACPLPSRCSIPLVTVGNLLPLGATSFIVGPKRQCRDMLVPQRRLASLAYIGTLVGTLMSIFVFHTALLSLLFIVLQVRWERRPRVEGAEDSRCSV